jgi:hypothetical protein
MWFMVLEKAIAKILGSYRRINEIGFTELMNIILLPYVKIVQTIRS